MEPKLNQDLIATIMLELPLKDVQSLILTDQLAASVDTNTFWRQKIIKDFNDINPMTNRWKDEYYKMYQSHMTATNFVKVLETDVKHKKCRIGEFYIPENINIKNIYWLSKNIRAAMDKENIRYDDYYNSHALDKDYDYEGPLLKSVVQINGDHFVYKLTIDYNVESNPMLYEKTDIYDRIEYINMISKFLYHYPNITFKHGNDTLLYKDLINKPNLFMVEKCVLNLWKQI